MTMAEAYILLKLIKDACDLWPWPLWSCLNSLWSKFRTV